ncbi:MAG: hypothetical protein FNT15_04210 [Sulfurovum sp.]|nr:MAG: hypothetical protein FNT15_04210 [Sulfurovum sp.]
MYKFLKIILWIFLIGVGLIFALFLIISLSHEYDKHINHLKEAEFMSKCESADMYIETDGFTPDELNSTNEINVTHFENSREIDNYSYDYGYIPVSKNAIYIIEQKNGQKYTVSDVKYKVGYHEDWLNYVPECIIDTCKIDGKLAKRCEVQFMK